MSFYANSSDSYWKEKQTTNERKSPFLVGSIVLLIVVASSGAIISNERHGDDRILTHRRTRDQTKETHWRQYESRVNSRQECTVICQPEQNSIQRKTMHQACLKGCQEAHVTSTAISCRGKVSLEKDLFNEIGGLAYVHCAKFQSVDPKPEVFATCRKYHRAGTKHGFRMGVAVMKEILDEEWTELKNEMNWCCDSSDLTTESEP